MHVHIPGYEIRSKLGYGAFAEVYLATQESLDREVALKVMNPRMASDEDLCERFISEARLVAQLRHRSIVAIHDVGKHHDNYYISMDYLPGPTLARCIREGVLPAPPLRIARQIAAALRCAHEHGIVHRDIKPGNILFDADNIAVLTDFGVAKNLGRDNPLTEVGSIIGTAAYMSPEQAKGSVEIDGRSDLYSLGIVLYEMLTGSKPFEGGDPFATALMHLHENAPRLPPELGSYQGLLDKLLAKNPEQRFASADELIAALSSLAVEISGERRGGKRTTPLVWTGAALGFALIAALAAWTLSQTSGVSQDPPGAGVGTEPDPPGTAERNAAARERVDKLIEIAEMHEKVGKIHSPPGANAVEAYEDALALDPENSKATEALRRLRSR